MNIYMVPPPPGTYLFNKSAVICSVFVENRRSPHRLRNSTSCKCQSARNLHRLNNFNSSQCLSVRNLHRLINFNFSIFFYNIVPPGQNEKISVLGICAVNRSGALIRRYADTPIRRYADTPLRRYAVTPIRRYADTPIRCYADKPLRR